MDAHQDSPALTLRNLPEPAKALATCIIIVLGIGMVGALGQIIVHDIIPTFFMRSDDSGPAMHAGSPTGMDPAAMPSTGDRGDLFSDLVEEKKAPQPFYQQDQFVWTLKWTHIHLLGMSMIFILLGAVTIWLDAGLRLRTWLVVLPFAGVLIDILAMWLKAFVSPSFFWLHLAGGGMFAAVFIYVALRALKEMWTVPDNSRVPHRQ